MRRLSASFWRERQDSHTSGTRIVWLALGKILLATGLILYTFITMVGGNPLHESVFHDYSPPIDTDRVLTTQRIRIPILAGSRAMGGYQRLSPH